MSPNPLAHLAQRPLAILPSALDSFALRFAEPSALAPTPEASRFVGQRTQGSPYRVQGDTAIIGVLNSLVTRDGSAWVRPHTNFYPIRSNPPRATSA